MRYSRKAFSVLFVTGMMGIGLIKKIVKAGEKETDKFLAKMIEQNSSLFSNEPIPADEEDKRFVNDLKQLDSYILRRANHDEYKDLFISVRGRCTELYRKWLAAKGVEKDTDALSGFPKTLCDFIYAYTYEQILLFNLIAPGYLALFFTNFVLSNVVVEAHKYAYAPTSIKLFYVFLSEKGYLDDPKPFMAAIDRIKPHFTEILTKKFV